MNLIHPTTITTTPKNYQISKCKILTQIGNKLINQCKREVIGWLMADRNDIRRAVRENPVIARPAARMEVKDKPVTLRVKERIFATASDSRLVSSPLVTLS